MKNIFNNAEEWNDKFINYVGLPRPFIKIKEDFRKSVNFFISKKVPVPWQSRPYLKDKAVFNVLEENESIVFYKSLCGYCGVYIKDFDNTVRWNDTNFKIENNIIQRPRVMSDLLPMHEECMKQARTFCPFMKKIPESDFQYGKYSNLIDFLKKTYPLLFK